MNRRALLINAGRACPGEIIDGCRSDVLQLKAWLESLAGGAWDEAPEICAMHNATLETLEIGVRWMNGADFAFLAFSGHGELAAPLHGLVEDARPKFVPLEPRSTEDVSARNRRWHVLVNTTIEVEA